MVLQNKFTLMQQQIYTPEEILLAIVVIAAVLIIVFIIAAFFFVLYKYVKVRQQVKKNELKDIIENVIEQKQITKREEEVFNCLMKGLSSKEIAFELDISAETVNIHKKNIFRKLKVQSTPQLMSIVIKNLGGEITNE